MPDQRSGSTRPAGDGGEKAGHLEEDAPLAREEQGPLKRHGDALEHGSGSRHGTGADEAPPEPRRD